MACGASFKDLPSVKPFEGSSPRVNFVTWNILESKLADDGFVTEMKIGPNCADADEVREIRETVFIAQDMRVHTSIFIYCPVDFCTEGRLYFSDPLIFCSQMLSFFQFFFQDNTPEAMLTKYKEGFAEGSDWQVAAQAMMDAAKKNKNLIKAASAAAMNRAERDKNGAPPTTQELKELVSSHHCMRF